MRLIALLCALLVFAPLAGGTTVKDLTRIEGQGESVLQGIGLVVGLNGTGDSGKELAVARPLARVLENNGLPLADLDELKNSRAVALVLLTCTVPATGARTDDKFDIRVSVVNSATSLEGGTLYLAPLTGPFRGDPVYAMAEGPVHVESEATPRTGIVRGGARMVRDIATAPIGDSFRLVLNPHQAGWGAAAEIASCITQQVYGRSSPREAGLPPIATVVDDRTVRVDIPVAERANRAAFIAEVLSTDINEALLGLPARVVCNRRTGAITVSGNVEISPVAITHRDLTITTILPPPTPTPLIPVINVDRWATLPAEPRAREKAKLQDLLAGFDQLNIPSVEQIEILAMLHRGGQLHGELIIE